MNELQCLVVSSSIDYSTDLVCLSLSSKESKYLRINRDQFDQLEIVLDVSNVELSIRVDNNTYKFRNSSDNSIYFRAPTFSRTYNVAHDLEEQLYHSQWASFLRNLSIFDRVAWMNNPCDTYRAENKILQLHLAQECGLNIPRTVVTNCTNVEEGFDRCIVKSIDTAFFRTPTYEYFTYSTLLKWRDLCNEDLSLAPICLQDYIEDKVDYRATYISGEFYSFQILMDKCGIEGDWRKTKKEKLTYEYSPIPCDVEDKLRMLMERLNLQYGGIDLVRQGESFVFIEVNPTGEWCWLQENSGIDICSAITRYLVHEKGNLWKR